MDGVVQRPNLVSIYGTYL